MIYETDKGETAVQCDACNRVLTLPDIFVVLTDGQVTCSKCVEQYVSETSNSVFDYWIREHWEYVNRVLRENTPTVTAAKNVLVGDPVFSASQSSAHSEHRDECDPPRVLTHRYPDVGEIRISDPPRKYPPA